MTPEAATREAAVRWISEAAGPIRRSTELSVT
jgi:hypothetical protein